ncbi:MAG: hypothetical protein JNM07_05035 [Phycisphaerae bacterium]|nr:hypothetical protein [Phycisphaerae bacterium]
MSKRPGNTSTTPSATSQEEGRLKNGRFGPGNKAGVGHGNPWMKYQKVLAQTVHNTVPPERLARVLRTLATLAEKGDVQAAKVLLDRVLGKAKSMGADLEGFEMPAVATPKDAVRASSAILQAVSEGRIGTDDAAKLAAVVELARRSIETHELAERVAALEARRRKDGEP